MHDSARAGVQDSAGNTTGHSLTPLTLVRFLIGRREAILAIANSRWAIWIGALFVFAAGLAREYDQEDLTRRPWVLLVPFAASMVITLLVLFITRTYSGPNRQPFGREYRSLLGVVWMIAPMAMLYGIPWERLLAPVDAMRANLWTLELVSIWRVALMVRVVNVLMGWSIIPSFFLVMLIADGLASAALTLLPVPLPIIQIMGGIRLSEADRLLAGTVFSMRVLTTLSLPVWIIGAILSRRMGKVGTRPDLLPVNNGAFPLGLVSLACLFVLVWITVLPTTQREQRLAADAEEMLRNGRLAEALAEMSRHQPTDYPPGWLPPPRVGWENERPDIIQVLNVMVEHEAAPWVHAIFVDKFERMAFSVRMATEDERWPTIRHILERLPEGPAIRDRHFAEIDVVAPDLNREYSPTTRPDIRNRK